ncbi:hypothetical protein A2U01_0016922, partial [Trifolium medium]|nr:hypothetical protein [Trifolium medium]
ANNQIMSSVCTEGGCKLICNVPKQLQVSNADSLKLHT